MLGLGLNLYKYRKLGGGFDPMAQAWFDEYEVQTGNPFPNTYKAVYNQLFLDLQGLGGTGSDNCFDAYKVVKGSPGYYDGINKWPLLSDFVTPTNTPMTEINGGGSYVNIGTDPNVYTKQAAPLKAWNTQETPNTKAYLTLSKAGYGAWILTDLPAANNLYLLGCADGLGGEVSMPTRFSGIQGAFAVHDGTYLTVNTSGTRGYYEMHRTAASGAGAVEAFREMGSLGTGAITSTTVPNKNIILCGYSDDNGAFISQTVSGGQTPNVGIFTMIDITAWTSQIGEQFHNSFDAFYTSLGITL